MAHIAAAGVRDGGDGLGSLHRRQVHGKKEARQATNGSIYCNSRGWGWRVKAVIAIKT
jgi:hypothetical protein